MPKKVILGAGDAYMLDMPEKTKVIDWLYQKLDLSKHRYNILNSIQRLEFLQKNIHYISPNFKGYNYLLLFLTVENNSKENNSKENNSKENIKYCVAIDRKKLSYHKSQLDMTSIQLFQFNMKINDDIFKGTIFDGKLIQNNNDYIFLIQDCFYLMGNKMLDMTMSKKMDHMNNIMNTYFKKDKNIESYCKNFEFKLNKLYNYDELEDLISNLSKFTFQSNGLIFYPQKSGITVLFIEKKVEKVIISTSNDTIEQKSYHIINDFIDFLKSRSYSYEANSMIKPMWLSRTEVPDVYDISEKEHGDKIGIAMIPNLKTSQMCDNIIGDSMVRFNCVYSNKFKKWIPLNVV
jgi:hypothetical protein